MDSSIVVYEGAPAPMTVVDMQGQVNLIQQIMNAVMKKDEHYGVIPGTNGKPSLLKAGAEKLLLTFRLVPEVDEEVVDLDGEHREYRVKVKLHSQNGVFLGAGVGCCTTKEGKYRYRTGPVELTGKPVPKEYWDKRQSDPAEAQKLLGGPGHSVKKDDHGQWMIAIKGERVEHDNPADYYNTCLKMAKKRALVDACLTVTAASDIFTQDVEDMSEVINAPESKTAKPPVAMPQTRKAEAETTNEAQAQPSDLISEAQRKRLFAISKANGYTPEDVKGYLSASYGIEHTSDIKKADYEAIVEIFSEKK